MALIPIGRSYTTALTGFVAREVRCEHCCEQYVYDMQRHVSEHGFSPLFLNNGGAFARSRKKAQQALQKRLREATEPVPCPSCGWCQSNAVAAERKLLWKWARILAVVAFVVCAGFLALTVFYIYDATSPERAEHFRARVRAQGNDPAEIRQQGLLIMTGVIVASAVIGIGLISLRHLRMALYDPNAFDVNRRIAAGRQRAYRPADMHLLIMARQTGHAKWRANWRSSASYVTWILLGLLWVIGGAAAMVLETRRQIGQGSNMVMVSAFFIVLGFICIGVGINRYKLGRSLDATSLTGPTTWRELPKSPVAPAKLTFLP